ncbi:hypothetical protein ES703_97192 [subsurface metagenome]
MREKAKTKKCKDCGREFPREDISHRGLCMECAMARVREANLKVIEAFRK